MTEFLARWPYFAFVAVSGIGLYLLVAHRNYLKGVIGLYLFQTSIILVFLLLSVRYGGIMPIQTLENGKPREELLNNPLPHALMLTAIVVGLATSGVALAILRRMHAEERHIDSSLVPAKDEHAGGKSD